MLGLVDVQKIPWCFNCDGPRTAGESSHVSAAAGTGTGGCPKSTGHKKPFPYGHGNCLYVFFFCVYTTCSTHGNIPWIKWLYAFISQSLWDLYKHKTINHSSNIPYLTCSTTSNWFPPKKILVRLDHHPISRAAKNHTFSTYNGSSSSPLYISITFYYVTFQIYGDNDVPMLSPWYTYIYTHMYIYTIFPWYPLAITIIWRA